MRNEWNFTLIPPPHTPEFDLYLQSSLSLYLRTILKGIDPRTKVESCRLVVYNYYGFCLLLLFSPQVCCSGVFELRLKSFINDYGKDSVGQCCSGTRSSDSGACSGPCRTRFRVCLKHYQANIDTTSPCTFGDVITPVLGENNVRLVGTAQRDGFANPIRFPFDFTWPVSTRCFLYR